MKGLLKGFLRLTANVFLVGGVLVALIMLLAGAIGAFGDYSRFANAGFGVSMALYILCCSLLAGGVLHLLLSIDDRLERLEARS